MNVGCIPTHAGSRVPDVGRKAEIGDSVDGADRSRYPKIAPTTRTSGMLPFGGGSFGGQGGDPMGHVRNGHGVYGRLQERPRRVPARAPPAEALFEILKRLHTEEKEEIT